MTIQRLFARLSRIDALNFAVTNRIPRRTLTRAVGGLSRIEQPLVRDLSIAAFRFFCEPDLGEARKTQFTSLRDCFIRELAAGRRPIDQRADVLVSPCDGIIVASGQVEHGMVLQVKGSSYALAELLLDAELADYYERGCFATLRLTAGMYHRFHSPHEARIDRVDHIAGEVFNVNPATLARIPRLYCRNERAVVRLRISPAGARVTLVPVAAVLVAGIKLHAEALPPDRYHREPWSRVCDVPVAKGEEMGWFEHGSTIIVLAPPGSRLMEGVVTGRTMRMGEPLMGLPPAS